MPALSARQNIVVIADEAHRSQYGFGGKVNEDRRDVLRLRQQPARCLAECVVHRLHRHAHREDGREHAGGLRRLHLHLRHPARRRRQGHGADLLREPHLQAEPERRRAAEARRGVRGDHRRRGADEEGEAQDEVGRAGGAGGRSETHRAGGRRPGGAFREARGGDGRQGDDRLHEPPHLRGPLQRAHQAAPRVGQRQGRRRRSREGNLRGEGRDDRQRRGRPRVADAHPQQGQAPQAGEPVQGQPKTPSRS